MEFIAIAILLAWLTKEASDKVKDTKAERRKNLEAYKRARKNQIAVARKYGTKSKEFASAVSRLERAANKVSWWDR